MAGLDVISGVLVEGGGRLRLSRGCDSGNRNRSDAMEEGVTSQGMWATLEGEKSKETSSPLMPSSGMLPCCHIDGHIDFSQIYARNLQKCKMIN